jgi:ATP-binding cassette subfamily B multidrug efflux pump
MMFIGALFMATAINMRLALVFLVVLPILAVTIYILATKAFPRFRAMLERYDALNGQIQENLIAIRVVKAFVREKHEEKKFEENADAVRRAQVFAEKLMILNMPMMQMFMFGTTLAVLYLGGNLVIGGSMAIGELSSFVSYVSQILMSLMMISMIFINIVLSRASLQRIGEVLDEKIDIEDSQADPTLFPADGSIELDRVSFGYGGESVLRDVSLSIRSGETIGIIGGTGSAKTTLVQLIPRLYDVAEGCVRVGGRDVRDYKLKNLRGAVAMVLQKNVLFSGTIRDNLRWGDETATEEEIRAASRAAQADDFVSSFPNGYDTELGQGGVNVSGGQKQRLCIARAMLGNPKVLILDDSTSAVDTSTDARIRQALRENLRDTTKLIIAQRITSVMDADRILILDDGRVDDIGTHDELLARNEIYREIYQSQQKGAQQ